ncbi:MAG: DUF4831 family protein [Bacteroidales bacterium]|nr:DUF4831 family protein [Bacteroidales bacterium]
MKLRYTFSMITLMLGVVLITGTTRAQINVIPVDPKTTPPNKEGIIYALPRNYFTFEVKVEKTVQKEGPYRRFADQFLGLNNVIQNDAERYELKSVEMTKHTEPDPGQYFFVGITKDEKEFRELKNLKLHLSQNGLIQYTQRQEDVMSDRHEIFRESIFPAKLDLSFIPYTRSNLVEKVDTIIRRINIDTTTVERVSYNRRTEEKTLEQKAREAAEFIRTIKEMRFNLLIGYQETAYEENTIKYMDGELQKLFNEYLALFRGKKATQTITYRFTYLPQKPGEENTLFRFSTYQGLITGNSNYSDPVNLKVESKGLTAEIEKFIAGRNEIPREETGYYYRIPEKAVISLHSNGEELGNTETYLNQFGVVTYLPFKQISNMEFHRETGMVKELIKE